MLQGLTTTLLSQAGQIFLRLAYPGGVPTIPPAKSIFLHATADQPLETLLRPPLCEVLRTPEGGIRGYAFRLGSATYPHLKLQVVRCSENASCVFAVDTHDALQLEPGHPDAAGWTKIQIANRQLKEQIERAWEAEGLLTFNGLLRNELEKGDRSKREAAG
jgi:hypothetical protein